MINILLNKIKHQYKHWMIHITVIQLLNHYDNNELWLTKFISLMTISLMLLMVLWLWQIDVDGISNDLTQKVNVPSWCWCVCHALLCYCYFIFYFSFTKLQFKFNSCSFNWNNTELCYTRMIVSALNFNWYKLLHIT